MKAKEGNQNQIETKEYTMNKVNNMENKMNNGSKMMGGVMTMMVAGLGMVGVLMTGQDAQGATATITSSSFSLGYGMTATGGFWDTTETAGANTATTIGDFTFSPTVTGNVDTANGPIFPGRVLTHGAPCQTCPDEGHRVSDSGSFGLSLLGSWNGPTPGDAAQIPNYQITVEITSLRIWAHAWPNPPAGIDGLWFHESTASHTADSSTNFPPNLVASYVG